jgi:hypothetical protein
MGLSPTEVTVIHPFHPFHGKRLEMERVLRGKFSHLVVIRTPEGKRMRLRRDWTDYDGAGRDKEQVTSPLLLDIKGLRATAKIFEHLKNPTLGGKE